VVVPDGLVWVVMLPARMDGSALFFWSKA